MDNTKIDLKRVLFSQKIKSYYIILTNVWALLKFDYTANTSILHVNLSMFRRYIQRYSNNVLQEIS